MILKQELIDFFKKHDMAQYRVGQVFNAVYKQGCADFGQINVLPKDLRKSLGDNFEIFSFTVEAKQISQNGDTVKAVFKLKDGSLIEGVLMRFKDGRNSVCVSSQVGCGLACAFCATGAMGLKRNLKMEEIADQVLYFDQYLKKTDASLRVTHVIFMGMGEPMLNYDEVMSAIRILNDPNYFGIAARHITVSTSGVVPGIEKFARANLQINLAVSLHAPDQKLREKLMPVAKAYRLDALMQAVKNYIKETGRRVSYEYVMLKNINDSVECAEKLAKLLKGQLCHVNLIPYNETYRGFENAGRERIDAFKQVLEKAKIPVTVRVSLGQDIDAACGQLSAKYKK